MGNAKDSMNTPNRFLTSPYFILLAFIGFLFLAIVLFTIGMHVFAFFAFRAEPFDESNPGAFVANIGQICDINFPTHMESLRAAGRIAGGVHPKPYVCIMRFTTDRAGFDQLRDSLSKLAYYSESFSNSGSGPRLVSPEKDTPSWYNVEAAEGVFYSCETANGGLLMDVVAVELDDGELVEVFLEGIGEANFKQRVKSLSTE